MCDPPVVEAICAVLPVTLRSFTATRNNSNVLLKWETATEENSKGFYIERNLGSKWEILGFVETKAINGTSNSPLIYDHVDMNNNHRLKRIE